MQSYPKNDLSSIHPPTAMKLTKAGRYLSVEDEMRLVSLLHAVVQAQEDYRFDWPKNSRGRFTMTFTPNGSDEQFEAIAFKFAGDEPDPAKFRTDWFNLVTDDDDNFDIKVEIIPPEVDQPTQKGWHALCLARNLEHELAYATLCFLEKQRPNNIKLQRCINCEKNVILRCDDYEYMSRSVWEKHIEELERCINDAMHGGVYAPMKANWGMWRIPQEYRNYNSWFGKQKEEE